VAGEGMTTKPVDCCGVSRDVADTFCSLFWGSSQGPDGTNNCSTCSRRFSAYTARKTRYDGLDACFDECKQRAHLRITIGPTSPKDHFFQIGLSRERVGVTPGRSFNRESGLGLKHFFFGQMISCLKPSDRQCVQLKDSLESGEL
jgi:hypothetical protein